MPALAARCRKVHDSSIPMRPWLGDAAAGGVDRDERLTGRHPRVKLGLELVQTRTLC